MPPHIQNAEGGMTRFVLLDPVEHGRHQRILTLAAKRIHNADSHAFKERLHSEDLLLHALGLKQNLEQGLECGTDGMNRPHLLGQKFRKDPRYAALRQ